MFDDLCLSFNSFCCPWSRLSFDFTNSVCPLGIFELLSLHLNCGDILILSLYFICRPPTADLRVCNSISLRLFKFMIQIRSSWSHYYYKCCQHCRKSFTFVIWSSKGQWTVNLNRKWKNHIKKSYITYKGWLSDGEWLLECWYKREK